MDRLTTMMAEEPCQPVTPEVPLRGKPGSFVVRTDSAKPVGLLAWLFR